MQLIQHIGVDAERIHHCSPVAKLHEIEAAESCGILVLTSTHLLEINALYLIGQLR